MLDIKFSKILIKIGKELNRSGINWVLTGSTSFVIRGIPMEVHDIDIQTDKEGAYEIERLFPSYIVNKVKFLSTEKMQSHFGSLEMNGIEVEIMGDISKRRSDGTWEDPVDLDLHKRYVEYEGMKIPVLSLKYESEAYRKMGRIEKAEILAKYAIKGDNT